MQPEQTKTPIGRGARFQVSLVALFLLLPFVAYARLAVDYAKEVRIEQALERHQATANLGARLLNLQWHTIVLQLHLAAEQGELPDTLEDDNPTRAQNTLRDMAARLPDLQSIAVYRQDGRLAAYYPANLPAAATASDATWLRAVNGGAAYFVGAPGVMPRGGQNTRAARVAPIALPLYVGKKRVGFLVAYWHLSSFETQAQTLGADPVNVYILTANGGPLITANVLTAPAARFDNYAPAHYALAGQAGGLLTPAPDHLTRAGNVLAFAPDHSMQVAVGYAFASGPKWAVLVVQPVETLVVSTNYLLRALIFPASVSMLLAAWAIARLVQQQAHFAQTLSGQNARLRALDHARADFLAHISHDLRTPLASIRLLLSGMSETSTSPDGTGVGDCCRQINEEIDHLTARVRNLLELSRLEADAWPLHKIPCDLTDLAGVALERMKPLLADRAVEVDFPSEPLLVDCDQTQIETVLVNLLENAVKYSPPHTPIFVRGTRSGKNALCVVEDQGKGVPPGEEARVFEKYYRAPSETSAPPIAGTGLGLAICRAILTAHGGAVGVEHAKGGGAAFWFILPLLPALETDLLQEEL